MRAEKHGEVEEGWKPTPRTSGFNTVDTASLTDLSLFITITPIVVAASPASTRGGVKTNIRPMSGPEMGTFSSLSAATRRSKA
jgi:hypothetical protein